MHDFTKYTSSEIGNTCMAKREHMHGQMVTTCMAKGDYMHALFIRELCMNSKTKKDDCAVPARLCALRLWSSGSALTKGGYAFQGKVR